MPSLTQSEAARRAALLDVHRYDIEIDLTDLPIGPEVRCVSTVTFSCREPGASSFVECAAQVVSAELDGVRLEAPVDGRIALPALRGDHVLRVESLQDDTAHGPGVHRAVDPADGEVYLWTSFEPDQAHHAWACFDQPDLKAVHAFTVTGPAAWTVLSNTAPDTVEPAGQGACRWTFAPTPPLSTYNVVVNAGPFTELRREAGGHDLGLYARRSLATVLERDADQLFTLTAQGLAFYAEAFAMPFPQRRYDQVFVPEFGGAMENFGCVTWSDSFLSRSTPTPAEWELFALVLLHEMAHMWFGNLVTMRWWDDLWLNEAFAEFACHWAAVGATVYTDVWAGFLAGQELRAYLADQGPGSHPIRQAVPDAAAAAASFDAITYPKGAAVLHQLCTYVGEVAFRRGMAGYFAEHAWGNTTLQDLVDALARASGRDLDAWRAGWLETAGTDRLCLEQHDGLVLTGRGPQGPPRPQVVAVGAYRRAGDQLERVALTRVEVQRERTPVDLPPADLYLVNDDDLTFATTRAADRDALLAAAPRLPSPLSRGVAVASVWDMLANGEVRAAEAVGCLTGVLAVETADPVVEPFLARAVEAAELWAPPADRDALLALVARTAVGLAARPALRRAALRAAIRTGSGELLDRLAQEAGDDVDLQWRLLARRAELGLAADPDAEAQLLQARDADPDAWVRALEVTAARPDPGAKQQAWQALVTDRRVPVGSVGDVTTAFWRPGQADLLAPYAELYIALLPQLHQGGMIPALVFSNRLFPVFGADVDVVQRIEQAAVGAAPVVAKTVRERADVVRRMLRARRGSPSA